VKRLALLRMAWLTLRRDRLGVALYAAVPIIFLSIFATVFQGFGRHGENRVRIAVLDLDRTVASGRLVAAARDGSDRIALEVLEGDDPDVVDALVASGAFPAGVVIPRGLAASLGDPLAEIPALVVRFDPANPIAPEFAQGVLSGAAWTGLSAELLGRQIRVLEFAAGPLTDRQRGVLTALESATGGGNAAATELVERVVGSARIPVESAPVEIGQGAPSLVSYYTAAIGVMFMLFSALSTTGWLLEEHERGILDRLRASGIGPWSVILNRFLFAVLVGTAQISVMLAWAAAAFGVRFFSIRQVVSLLILVPSIAAAAAGLGLLITGLARTRRQQTTIGTIAVLILSAVGGSMIPSFMMPPSLQAIGDWAFNARAIAAMQQVLWYTTPTDTTAAMLGRIAPALGLVAATTVACLVGARVLVARWR
jgi:ABC-2 type transport system permease protein